MVIMQVKSVIYRTEKITAKSTVAICNFRKKKKKKNPFKVRNVVKRKIKRS